MIFYVDAIGALLLLGGACALAACWLIDRHHERTPLFAGGYERQEPLPEPGLAADAPFPGDPEPAPAASKPAAAEHDPADDTVWGRHEIKQVWELLNAEAKP